MSTPTVAPNPSPSPQPGSPPPNSIDAAVAAMNAAAAAGASGGSGGSNMFGLGPWGSTVVDVTGVLPGGGALKLDDAVQRFIRSAMVDPITLSTIQRALWLGGFYGSTPPTFGLLRKDDQTAFAQALLTLAKGNEANKPVEPGQPTPPQMGLGAFLTQQARLGKMLTPPAAKQRTTNEVAQVKLPNPQDLYAVARQAFSKILGRTANAAEQQAFADYFTNVYGSTVKSGMQQYFDAQTQAQAPPVVDQLPPVEEIAPTPAEKFALGKQQRIDTEQLRGQGADAQFKAGIDAASTPPSPPSTADAAGTPTLTTVTTVAPPDAAVAAEDFARSRNPAEAGSNDVARVFNDFLSLITSKGMM